MATCTHVAVLVMTGLLRPQGAAGAGAGEAAGAVLGNRAEVLLRLGRAEEARGDAQGVRLPAVPGQAVLCFRGGQRAGSARAPPGGWGAGCSIRSHAECEARSLKRLIR